MPIGLNKHNSFKSDFIYIQGGNNVNTSSWGANQPPQQWDQPSGSNASVNVNAGNANVGQNANMWPTTSANQGRCPLL